MPLTYWTFLIGTLALCGVPPFSGFYSKDEILAVAFEHGQFVLFGVGVGVAMLTALYMFRLVWIAFGGSARSAAVNHAQESPRIITLPLVALAIPSALAGFLGIDHYLAGYFTHGRSGEAASLLHRLVAPFAQAPLPAWAGLVAVGVGFVAAWQLYREAKTDPLPRLLGGFAQAMRERFYIDELYAKIMACTQDALAVAADWLDRWILAGTLVRGVHGTVELAGRLLRLMQTGNLQTYALVVATGVLLLLYCLIVR
jgi:NADH-quinone oxidoreductase subunit L